MGLLRTQATKLHFLQAVGFPMLLHQRQFLFSFAISLKTNISAVMSVCLCDSFVVMNNSALTGKMLMKPDVLGFFEYVSRTFKTLILHEDYLGESGASLEIFKI